MAQQRPDSSLITTLSLLLAVFVFLRVIASAAFISGPAMSATLFSQAPSLLVAVALAIAALQLRTGPAWLSRFVLVLNGHFTITSFSSCFFFLATGLIGSRSGSALASALQLALSFASGALALSVFLFTWRYLDQSTMERAPENDRSAA